MDRAIELDHVGGASGGVNKPTDFICLVLKMLQIQPDKDIVVEFIKNEDYKCGQCCCRGVSLWAFANSSNGVCTVLVLACCASAFCPRQDDPLLPQRT